LPIARRIVEAHGGRLTVESTPAVETIFRVELPLAERIPEN
jgi:signal transduction histidine kinase